MRVQWKQISFKTWWKTEQNLHFHIMNSSCIYNSKWINEPMKIFDSVISKESHKNAEYLRMCNTFLSIRFVDWCDDYMSSLWFQPTIANKGPQQRIKHATLKFCIFQIKIYLHMIRHLLSLLPIMFELLWIEIRWDNIAEAK